MPGGDGTGPMGMGAMTGRAAGYCAGYAAPGFVNRGPGRGFGRGFGGGRGWRNMYHATGLPGWARAGAAPSYGAYPEVTPELELNGLKAQAQQMQGMLDQIQKRMDELAGETKDK